MIEAIEPLGAIPGVRTVVLVSPGNPTTIMPFLALAALSFLACSQADGTTGDDEVTDIETLERWTAEIQPDVSV